MVALIALNPNDESKNTVFFHLRDIPTILGISTIQVTI